NHEHVKCQMRERYREQKEMDDTDTTEGCVIEVDHARRAPNEIHPLQPLARAQDLLKQFSDYIGPSNDKFVAHAMDLVRCDYRPGESSPILDQIEEQIADWQTNIQGIQNEILNGAGAWSAEYLEVEGILEAVNASTRSEGVTIYNISPVNYITGAYTHKDRQMDMITAQKEKTPSTEVTCMRLQPRQIGPIVCRRQRWERNGKQRHQPMQFGDARSLIDGFNELEEQCQRTVFNSPSSNDADNATPSNHVVRTGGTGSRGDEVKVSDSQNVIPLLEAGRVGVITAGDEATAGAGDAADEATAGAADAGDEVGGGPAAGILGVVACGRAAWVGVATGVVM
ncbi:hypothetical protein BDZ89DRAFT_1054734, partial [Hymenopellis radicata]